MEFRNDFRVPYVVYQDIVREIDESSDEAFNSLKTQSNCIGTRTGYENIPNDILILACLRILGRNVGYADIRELTGISIPKIQSYFLNFVKVYGSRKFLEVVNPPNPENMEELEECMDPNRRTYTTTSR